MVGVVRDSKYNDLRDSRLNPMIWVPIAQAPFPISSISLRTVPGAEASVARRAEEVLRATDPDIMVRSTTTLSAQIAGKTSRERLLLGLSVRIRGPGDPAGSRRPLRHARVHGEPPHA